MVGIEAGCLAIRSRRLYDCAIRTRSNQFWLLTLTQIARDKASRVNPLSLKIEALNLCSRGFVRPTGMTVTAFFQYRHLQPIPRAPSGDEWLATVLPHSGSQGSSPHTDSWETTQISWARYTPSHYKLITPTHRSEYCMQIAKRTFSMPLVLRILIFRESIEMLERPMEPRPKVLQILGKSAHRFYSTAFSLFF